MSFIWPEIFALQIKISNNQIVFDWACMPTVYCYPVKLTIADLIRAKSICSQTQFSRIINRLLTSLVRSVLCNIRPHFKGVTVNLSYTQLQSLRLGLGRGSTPKMADKPSVRKPNLNLHLHSPWVFQLQSRYKWEVWRQTISSVSLKELRTWAIKKWIFKQDKNFPGEDVDDEKNSAANKPRDRLFKAELAKISKNLKINKIKILKIIF